MMKIIRIYSTCAGACDALTGLLLMFAPALTLRLMLIPEEVAEPVYIRFIGAFVFAIGSSYFLPYLQKDPAKRTDRFIAMLEITMFVRICIATFSLTAILSGLLGMAWISVFATDTLFATTQAILLHRVKSNP